MFHVKHRVGIEIVQGVTEDRPDVGRRCCECRDVNVQDLRSWVGAKSVREVQCFT